MVIPRRIDDHLSIATSGYPTGVQARKRLREKRERAAGHYKPKSVHTLLVAEAPPSSADRYFYFPDVPEQDSLFRYVVRGVLEVEPSRTDKPSQLAELCDRGIFLIDLIPDPIGDTAHEDHVPALLRRAKQLKPGRIILIKAPVYDAAYQPLVDAGLPVINERIPFPGSGQQCRFEEAFTRALKS